MDNRFAPDMSCRHFCCTHCTAERATSMMTTSPTWADEPRAGPYAARVGFIQVIVACSRLSKHWHTTHQPSALGHMQVTGTSVSYKQSSISVCRTSNHLSCVLTCRSSQHALLRKLCLERMICFADERPSRNSLVYSCNCVFCAWLYRRCKARSLRNLQVAACSASCSSVVVRLVAWLTSQTCMLREKSCVLVIIWAGTTRASRMSVHWLQVPTTQT